MAKLYPNGSQNQKRVYLTMSELVNSVYAPKKEEALRVAQLYNDSLKISINNPESRAYRVSQCGDWLEFKSPVINNEVVFSRSKLNRANFCRDRFCPLCQYRLSIKHKCNLFRVVEYLTNNDFRLLFLTLTIPNMSGNELRDHIDLLNSAWSRFTHLKQVKEAWLGYYKTLEVTYNPKSKTYHPHIHCLVAVDSSYFNNTGATKSKYMSHDKVRALWAKCNKPIIELYNQTHDTPIYELQCRIQAVKQVAKSIKEVSKYCCKTEYVLPETIKTLYYALFNVRNLEYCGVFRKVYKELCLNENLEDDLSPDINYVVTHWNYKSGSYSVNQFFSESEVV